MTILPVISKARTFFTKAIHLALCFNLCCDAFTHKWHDARSIRTQRQVVLNTNPAVHPPLWKRKTSMFGQSPIRNRSIFNKKLSSSFQLLLTTYGDVGNTSHTRQGCFRFPLLERLHEKLIYIVFGGIGAAILYFAGVQSQTNGLPPIKPGKWLIMAETSVALTWSSMILAISFLEAWTKFRAPFLKKYVAVDVGRHVFAALNSAELGFVSSLWLHRAFQCYQVQKICGGALMYKSMSYYEQFSFTLPAVATFSLLMQVLVIAPQLYVRAKRKILEGFDEALPSVKISLSKEEQAALNDIAQDVRRTRRIPSRFWHSLYALLEMVKMGCLNAFVILSWLKVLK